MRKFLLACALAALAGCDFSVPLVRTPDLEIEPALTGVWRISDPDGQKENLLVLPLNRREYLVSYPAGTENALFARAALWRSGDARLLQLDWFGTARGTVPGDSRTFQFARFTLEGDTLKAALVEPAEELKRIAAPEELARALRERWETPGTFRETLVFTRVRPPGTPAPAAEKAPVDKPLSEQPQKPAPGG